MIRSEQFGIAVIIRVSRNQEVEVDVYVAEVI
jgi:hypothetical protein